MLLELRQFLHELVLPVVVRLQPIDSRLIRWIWVEALFCMTVQHLALVLDADLGCFGPLNSVSVDLLNGLEE